MKFIFIEKIKRTGKQYPLQLMFILSVVITIIAGCAQYDSSVGGVISDRELRGVLQDTIIPVEEFGTAVRGDVYKPSPSGILPLGKESDFTSDVIFYFSNFNTLGDTILQIDSVWFDFQHYRIEDTTIVETVQNPFTASLYHLDSEIDLDTLAAINLSDYNYTNTDYLELLDEVEIGWDADFDSAHVEIDPVAYKTWLDSAMADTSGILLRLRPDDNATFMRQIASNKYSTSSKLPCFKIKGTFVSDEDTLTDSTFVMYASYSSFLADDDFVTPAGYLTLSEGFSRRLLFYSPFSWLDSLNYDPSDGSHSDHSLNLVELVIHTDHDAAANFNGLSLVSANAIDTTWFDDPDNAEYGLASPYLYHDVDSSLTMVRINITSLVRSWVALGDTTNHGIAIRGTNELVKLSRRMFYDNTAPEELRPTFRVIYTEFKE